MSSSKEEKNKALVLEAFDNLFNKRDYTAAERFWSPNYIQHSAHIEPGRDGLLGRAPKDECGVHQIVDFADDGGWARTQVVLHSGHCD